MSELRSNYEPSPQASKNNLGGTNVDTTFIYTRACAHTHIHELYFNVIF